MWLKGFRKLQLFIIDCNTPFTDEVRKALIVTINKEKELARKNNIQIVIDCEFQDLKKLSFIKGVPFFVWDLHKIIKLKDKNE